MPSSAFSDWFWERSSVLPDSRSAAPVSSLSMWEQSWSNLSLAWRHVSFLTTVLASAMRDTTVAISGCCFKGSSSMSHSSCPNSMWTVLLALHCGVNCAAWHQSTFPLVADLVWFSHLDTVTSSSDHSSARPSKHVGSTRLMDAASTVSIVGQKLKGMSWIWVCHGIQGEVSMVWTRVFNLRNSSSAH